MSYDLNPFLAMQNSLALTTNSIAGSFLIFFPRLLASLLVFAVGIIVARWIRSVVVSTLDRLRLGTELAKTPLQGFLHNAEVSTKIEVIIGSIVYWLLVLVILQTSTTLLGLSAVSDLLSRILHYLPRVFSSVLVLFLGTVLAGIAESVVKGAFRTIDSRSSRLLGVVTGYLVMIISIMAAISELGIAQQFITTLFTGLVASISLALGLAFGLGSKDTVSKLMDEWYEKMKR